LKINFGSFSFGLGKANCKANTRHGSTREFREDRSLASEMTHEHGVLIRYDFQGKLWITMRSPKMIPASRSYDVSVSTVASESEDPGTGLGADGNVSSAPDISEALRQQMALRSKVDIANSLATMPELVAGLDVSYEAGTRRVAAVAIVMESRTLEVREISVVHGDVHFPYVPGLLAFREVPILLEALENLACQPDVLVCDGYGIAHPRRFGLASHMGVLTGLPSFGVAKSPFVGTFSEPGERRGGWSPLAEDGETLGRVLRTQTGIRPVFVSVGHRISLDQATDLTLTLSRRYRIPEATRQADILSREALRKLRE